MATSVVDKRVYRSRDACVGGVCAGLAERFDVDPIVVRILAVFFLIMTAGLAGIVYLVLWVRLPREDEAGSLYEVTPESAESSALGCIDCCTGRMAGEKDDKQTDVVPLVARLAVAVVLVVLFLLVSTNLSPLMPGTEWWQFWPMAILILGLFLIIVPIPTRLEMAWHCTGIIVTSVGAMLLPMALGVVSWHTLPGAFALAWPLIAAGLALFALGAYRKNNALFVVGALCFVAFCVIALTVCSLPGELETLLLHMPDGRLLRISIVS